jgi:hypothetical protein
MITSRVRAIVGGVGLAVAIIAAANSVVSQGDVAEYWGIAMVLGAGGASWAWLT